MGGPFWCRWISIFASQNRRLPIKPASHPPAHHQITFKNHINRPFRPPTLPHRCLLLLRLKYVNVKDTTTHQGLVRAGQEGDILLLSRSLIGIGKSPTCLFISSCRMVEGFSLGVVYFGRIRSNQVRGRAIVGSGGYIILLLQSPTIPNSAILLSVISQSTNTNQLASPSYRVHSQIQSQLPILYPNLFEPLIPHLPPPFPHPFLCPPHSPNPPHNIHNPQHPPPLPPHTQNRFSPQIQSAMHLLPGLLPGMRTF